MCKRPKENPAGSCQCSVDPVLSSHDAPYFETYLSSQAFFTFVTTLASMEVCFTLFLYPFPSTVQNYIQLSLCTTNPWYNELPGITNYTILQNKSMRRCGVPPPTNNFRLSYPNKLYIVGKEIYPRVRIILNIGKIFWFRDFMSNFREVIGF